MKKWWKRGRKDSDLPLGLTHSPRIGRTSQGQGASASGWISSGTHTSDSSTASGWANSQTHPSPPLTLWGWGSPSARDYLQREKAGCPGPRETSFIASQPSSLPGAQAAIVMCTKKFHVEGHLSVLEMQCDTGLRKRLTWLPVLALS